MKNKFIYSELNMLEKFVVLKCYDMICKRIASQTDADMSFSKDYRWFVLHNQIKPANISRKILTPHWDIVGDMLATKILIKILKVKL